MGEPETAQTEVENDGALAESSVAHGVDVVGSWGMGEDDGAGPGGPKLSPVPALQSLPQSDPQLPQPDPQVLQPGSMVPEAGGEVALSSSVSPDINDAGLCVRGEKQPLQAANRLVPTCFGQPPSSKACTQG